jgi:hypothetical protein
MPSILEIAYARTGFRILKRGDVLPAKALAMRPTLYIQAIRE